MPGSGGWQHPRITTCITVHPNDFLMMVFTQNDAIRAAPPRPTAVPDPTTRWQQQSRTQSPGEGGWRGAEGKGGQKNGVGGVVERTQWQGKKGWERREEGGIKGQREREKG